MKESSSGPLPCQPSYKAHSHIEQLKPRAFPEATHSCSTDAVGRIPQAERRLGQVGLAG